MVATLVFSVSTEPDWEVVATSVMFAAASLAAGALLGLLFGVPRSLGIESEEARRSGGVAQATLPSIGANTNLEQISDWLTKIIVGVSLTQLASIRSAASDLFNFMAPVLGGPPTGAAFAGTITVYFSVVGFLSGWLYARLRLGIAMSSADAWLALAHRADRAGDRETAQRAMEAASTSVALAASSAEAPIAAEADIESLAAQYEEIRNTMTGSPRRTARMEDVVRRTRSLAQRGRFSVQDISGLFATGTEGRRIVALALMEGNTDYADVAAVASAIRQPKSAFEQYHALYVANLLVSTLGTDERAVLRQALEDPAAIQLWSGDTSRASLHHRIMSRLIASPGNAD
ncbi:hypothetical protein [Nocardioides taihuensis]|uniref:DUF4192 domain-containing protein n=1 Tax=Nocardioides taihuensis TaxID=1835606 RepID=A0ABW0BKL0_9ACTN